MCIGKERGDPAMALKYRYKSMFLILIMLLSTLLTGMASATGTSARPERIDVIIAFHHQPGASEEAFLEAFGGHVKRVYHIVPAIAASIPQAALEGLMKNPRVARVESDVEIQAHGETTPWGVLRIDADDVQMSGNKGTGVKVAVVDSGVDYSHPDISGNYAGGYDFVNRDTDPMDDNGHGTHVAGTIAAVAGNDQGVVGVAPEVSIYALKVLGKDGRGSFSNVIEALQWCVDNDIKITNNSYGSAGDPGQTVRDAFDNAYSAGILHVASAGNSGNAAGTGDSVGYPAKYDSVIAVAATDIGDNRASFSSTGPKVEMAAPGVSIYSTIPGNQYAYYSGTSMASPHVAGVAALVYRSGLTAPVTIRAKLQNTADDLGISGRDSLYGYGLVDADEAAGMQNPPPNTAPTVTITSPANGSTFKADETISFVGSASDLEDGELTAGIVWTSSIDGLIGTGGMVSDVLSIGTHIITGSVTDDGGMTGSASIGITVVPTADLKPDLVLTALSAPTKGVIGRNINSVATVKNIGNSNAGTFDVSYYLSVDKILDSNDPSIGKKSVSGLAAGVSVSINAKVLIPTGTVAGTYWVIAVVDGTGKIAESDEANNVLAAGNATSVSKK